MKKMLYLYNPKTKSQFIKYDNKNRYLISIHVIEKVHDVVWISTLNIFAHNI